MRRPLILGLAGALLLAAALALQFGLGRSDRGALAPTDSPPLPPPVAEAAPPPRARAAPVAPSFDVVRVNPRGDAVIAGRAEPGAEVEVRDGGRVIGRVTADERGEWVVLPSEPLAGGQRALSLQSTRPGEAPLSSEVVTLDRPRSASAAAAGASANSAAAAGASANSAAAAGASANSAAAVGASANSAAAAGASANSAAAAGASASSRVASALSNPTEQAVVEPGNSLWELARRRYGHGTAYGAIYQANRGQIRDPDLIYPGQVFVMPPGP